MLNTAKKIDEGLQQLSNDQFYMPLPSPTVQDTARKVNELVNIKTIPFGTHRPNDPQVVNNQSYTPFTPTKHVLLNQVSKNENS